MLHLKQTLRNTYTTSSLIISMIRTEFKSHGVVALSSPLVENLGKTLLSLVLLMSIPLLLIVTFILNLLLLLVQILMKLGKLLLSIAAPGSSVRYILCRWEDVRKSIILMLKKLLTSVWKKAGDSPQDYTFHSSEMRGELKNSKQLQTAMKKPVKKKPLDDELREKGLI
jgi:hypothetical protein